MVALGLRVTPDISTLRPQLSVGAMRWRCHFKFNQPIQYNCEECPYRSFSEGGHFHFCYTVFVYYVYILQLKDKSYYHGSALDLKERLNYHRTGNVSSTKNLRPFKLVFYAAFVSKQKAMQFEKYLKTTSGWAFRNKRLI